MELYLANLSNNSTCYVMAEDIGIARDKVDDWLDERFIGGSPVSIMGMKILAETKTRGRGAKLLL